MCKCTERYNIVTIDKSVFINVYMLCNMAASIEILKSVLDEIENVVYGYRDYKASITTPITMPTLIAYVIESKHQKLEPMRLQLLMMSMIKLSLFYRTLSVRRFRVRNAFKTLVE